MHIGIVTHNYPPHTGGLETIVRELACGFARGHQVTVVSTAWKGRTGVSREDGLTVHRLPAWHGTEERGVPYAAPLGPGLFRAAAALRSCDVLHAHGSLYLTTILATLARRRRTPLFVTEHVGYVPYQSALINTIQRLAWMVVGDPVLRRSIRVIAYNSRVHDWLAQRLGERSVTFIRNGVDVAMFQPRDEVERRAARVRLGLPVDGTLALFVGRAAQKKNLDAVLAFPATDFRLVVCGAERSVPNGVFNLGAVDHARMPEVFAASDFLLHAAVGEGFPVAVQEAMASGLPVALLWDAGYAGSVDREAVMAVSSIEELSGVADLLARSTERRAGVGRSARTFAAANWSWDWTVQRHLDLFTAAVKGCA